VAENAIPHKATKMTASPALRYKNLDDLILLPDFIFTGETPMNINDKAPDFTLQDQDEKEVSLKDFRGKVVVLYFYPRADTPG
jgi:cytochrome oxidase Cu insertion factor (SCO1/SenC/PrrC family)